MFRAFALPAMLIALGPFQASVTPLPAPVRTELKAGGFWHEGCPVALSRLRLLTVTHHGFDGRDHVGQLVVNRDAGRLTEVFRRLYALHFPIRHMTLADEYGTSTTPPRNGDVSASFSCRQAVPSPCTGGKGTGTWSMHAFGLAVDLNPTENPYVGCGATRDRAARRYRDRSRHRRGMVTARTVGAFRSIGWGWGGSWTGNTKDFMHFSSTGH